MTTATRAECARCAAPMIERWERRYCLQCGYEDYTHVVPVLRDSDPVHYRVRYEGDSAYLLEHGAVLDVRVRQQRPPMPEPKFHSLCPFCGAEPLSRTLNGELRRRRQHVVAFACINKHTWTLDWGPEFKGRIVWT